MGASKQRVTAVTLEMIRCSDGNGFRRRSATYSSMYGMNPALKRGAKVKRHSAATLLHVFSHSLMSE